MKRRYPNEPDWRVRRAEYLFGSGRLEELRAEGLTHFLPANMLVTMHTHANAAATARAADPTERAGPAAARSQR